MQECRLKTLKFLINQQAEKPPAGQEGSSLCLPLLWCSARNYIARPLHIEYPDTWHQVMNQSRGKEKIFADRKACSPNNLVL